MSNHETEPRALVGQSRSNAAVRRKITGQIFDFQLGVVFGLVLGFGVATLMFIQYAQ